MVYVTCTDKDMSDWGLAKGKISKMICHCETKLEAEKVESLWLSHKGKKYVNICTTFPKYDYYPERYHVSHFRYTETGIRVIKDE